MAIRRPLVRTVRRTCHACGSRVTVEVPPAAYVRHVAGREQSEVAVEARCTCGETLEITVGQVARAA